MVRVMVAAMFLLVAAFRDAAHRQVVSLEHRSVIAGGGEMGVAPPRDDGQVISDLGTSRPVCAPAVTRHFLSSTLLGQPASGE